MALPPLPTLGVSVVLAGLLSSCLLFADTEIADPVPEDTGTEDHADVRPVDGDQRCVHRVVEVYRAETESWEELEVCTQEQYCLDGACVGIPEGFGEDCESSCRVGLECIDSLCLIHEPSDVGGDCIGDEECEAGLLCTRRGYCQSGVAGDPCMDADDCDRTVAPICDGSACAPSGVGEPCFGDGSCNHDTLYCGPDGLCHDGLSGDPCNETSDCNETDDICDGSPGQCRARIEGDGCSIDAECPTNLYCASSVGECRDGSTGDLCDDTRDCDQVDDICNGEPARCRDRVEGDACDTALQCPGTAAICSTTSVCQDGNGGDDCGEHDDCGSSFHCGVSGQCAAGDPGVGEACSSDARCASRNCSNEHCAPEGFAYIPAGKFCMGSPDGALYYECTDGSVESGRELDEGPLHEVTLTRGFFLQETEVTQRQWTAMGFTNPSSFDECGPDCPVETVNWWEAVAYVNALSLSEGLEPCYTLEGCEPANAGTGIQCTGITVSDLDASGNPYLCEGYRLPTEAEWEYAYRAGTRTAFYNGGITNTEYSPLDETLDLIGWYGGNSGVSYSPGSGCSGWYEGSTVCGTHEVGGKDPNYGGLHDMSGNVWEWVWDWSDTYPSGLVEDPLGGTGLGRVIRGGSWHNFARRCRAASRGNGGPGYRYDYIGLRPARSDLSSHP